MSTFFGKYDYVIVGAGTAGCVLANRLSANPTHRVLLLEAGGKDDWIWIHIPVGYLYCIGNSRTDWCYRTEPCDGLNGRSILYARGKVLGGCSSINAMIYMRGQALDYDAWAAGGNPGWSWNDVLPIFKHSEDHYLGASEIHGAGGEWRVEEQRLEWEILNAWRDAATQCGIPKVFDFNGGDNFGSARFQVNQRTGVRWNASKGFLRPALSRTNLTVLTKVHATKIRFKLIDGRQQAVGIEFIRNNETYFAEASCETILASGAINSPQLLQLSGIGPGPLLAEHAITLVQELAGVGENLQDHLELYLQYACTQPVSLYPSLLWYNQPAIGAEWLFNGTGIGASNQFEAGGFIRTREEFEWPNIQYHFLPVAINYNGSNGVKEHGFQAHMGSMRSPSRGRIQLKSKNPRDYPSILFNYMATEQDWQEFRDGIRLTREIMQQPALDQYRGREISPGIEVQTDEQLDTFIREHAETAFHPDHRHPRPQRQSAV